MGGVVEATEARQPRHLPEHRQQVLGVAVRRADPKVLALPHLGEFQPLPGARDQRAVQQTVVLEEAEEDESQDPVHRRLVHGGAEEGL